MDFFTIVLGPPLPQRVLGLSACKFAITNRHSLQAMSKKSWPPETRETANYFKLPTWADDNHVHAVFETPLGSRVKVEFDPKLGEVPGMARPGEGH
jgi:hypothetical protein